MTQATLRYKQSRWAAAAGVYKRQAQKGHETVLRALIEAGADVNEAIDDGTTPLYIAAREGHEASVRTMIEADADVNKAVDEDVTPLFIATEKEYAAIVQIIRDAGAV